MLRDTGGEELPGWFYLTAALVILSVGVAIGAYVF